jgi:hypothetical protein
MSSTLNVSANASRTPRSAKCERSVRASELMEPPAAAVSPAEGSRATHMHSSGARPVAELTAPLPGSSSRAVTLADLNGYIRNWFAPTTATTPSNARRPATPCPFVASSLPAALRVDRLVPGYVLLLPSVASGRDRGGRLRSASPGSRALNQMWSRQLHVRLVAPRGVATRFQLSVDTAPRSPTPPSQRGSRQAAHAARLVPTPFPAAHERPLLRPVHAAPARLAA